MVALSGTFPAPKESFHLISCPFILLSICSEADVRHFKVFAGTNGRVARFSPTICFQRHKIIFGRVTAVRNTVKCADFFNKNMVRAPRYLKENFIGREIFHTFALSSLAISLTYFF